VSAIPNPSAALAHGSLPSGTITFAFTDIEGSTVRWDRDPPAMQAAVRRHDALMRAAISEQRGHVFKTIGDAFCAAFARPEAAVAAMLAVQRDLAAEDFSAVDGLRVRVAIHTGTADERDGDYFGPALNRVARLLAIGHGGQVLISGVTAELVHSALPAEATLRDLGEHRLRDLTRPEHVYQLSAPNSAADFPPLRSLNALPNNLPQTPNTFIGRETEVAEITALIREHPLVTLTGSGGVGKTRASLQVAANLLDGFVDGVWFIELAPLSSGDYIPSTVAHVLGIALATGGDPVEHLVRALLSKHALLVLDNCEHLIEPTAGTIAAILGRCPRVRVLATSRQGLGIRGEATYRMPSLTLPSAATVGALTAADAPRFAAIALFIERARAADNRFTLSDQNARTIAEICWRLDGLPLAIELAASRVKILSPRQLHERLDQRLRVLTGGSRDALPRQQTIRALIDWSHDLLDDHERMLFRRLGIFVNGFTLEGAVAVGSGEDLDEFAVFDVLASLVDKSLVLAELDGDAQRYRLLESTRAYALEKLADADERELLAGCHLRYLRDHFADLRARFEQTARHTELEDRLATELEDVRSALDGALSRSDLLGGGELLAIIATSWKSIGYSTEGIAWLERYLAADFGNASLLLARLLTALSLLLTDSGLGKRALEVATQAVAHARAAGDGSTLAAALDYYSYSAASLGMFDEAETALAEAEAIPRASAPRRLALLQSRAHLSLMCGDLVAAARTYEQIRAEYRSRGYILGEHCMAMNLASIENERGQTQRAIGLVREILPAIRAARDTQFLAVGLLNLAAFLVAADDLTGAAEAAREVIGLYAKGEQDHMLVVLSIERFACVHALRGDLTRAAMLEGYADAAFQRIGYERDFSDKAVLDRLSRLLRERFTPDECERLTAEGAALTPEAASALALK